MPLFETPRATRMNLQLPRATPWPELEEATSRHNKLVARERQLQTERGAVINRRAALAEKDRLALADAQYDDPTAALPANPDIEKVEAEIAGLTRQIEAIGSAIDRAESEVVEVIQDNREEWADEVSPAVDEAYAAYLEAIDHLEAARKRVADRASLHYWLRNFDDSEPKKAMYRPVTDPYLPIIKQNEEWSRLSELIEILKKDAVRPVAQEQQTFIQWGASPFRTH